MNVKVMGKKKVQDLSYFGGSPLFSKPKSTSSLAQPDVDVFLRYSKKFYNERQFTNNGPLVRLLEQRLSKFHDSKFCIAFCNGFWGLVLAMVSLALKGRSEVIIPSLTYRRMADLSAWASLKPRFCEVDRSTLSVNRQTVSECINSETALILAVHPIVNCCDVEGVVSLGKEHGIPVLFDSVESAYETSTNGKVGKFGDAECFSMHASKLLNGFEGGYVTTNNEALANKLSLLRSFGFQGQDNCLVSGGTNAKLNEMHAAMALANLDGLEQLVADNRERYLCYQTGLERIPGIKLLEFDESLNTSYKNIVVELLDDWPLKRNTTVDILNAENILARAYYSPPVHRKSMNYPHIPASLEVTDALSQSFMLLPCGDFVTNDDIVNILEVLEFMSSCGLGILHCLAERAEKIV